MRCGTSLTMNKNRYKPWSEEDKQFIRDNWETMTDVEIAEALGRTRTAIGLMRHRMGLVHSPNKITDEEIEFIKSHVGKITYSQIAKELGRSLPTIYETVRKLFPERYGYGTPWDRYSVKDSQFLKVNMKSMSIFELAEVLNRSPKSIAAKLLRDGFLDDDEEDD